MCANWLRNSDDHCPGRSQFTVSLKIIGTTRPRNYALFFFVITSTVKAPRPRYQASGTTKCCHRTLSSNQDGSQECGISCPGHFHWGKVGEMKSKVWFIEIVQHPNRWTVSHLQGLCARVYFYDFVAPRCELGRAPLSPLFVHTAIWNLCSERTQVNFLINLGESCMYICIMSGRAPAQIVIYLVNLIATFPFPLKLYTKSE